MCFAIVQAGQMLCGHAFATTLRLATAARAHIGSSTVTSCVKGLFSTPQTVNTMVAAALHKATALPSAIACAALMISAAAAPICMLTASAGNVCRAVQSYLWAGGHQDAVVPEAGPAHAERLHALTVSPATNTYGQDSNGSEEGHATLATQLAATAAADGMLHASPLPAVTQHMSSSSQQQPASASASPAAHPVLPASEFAAADYPSGEQRFWFICLLLLLMMHGEWCLLFCCSCSCLCQCMTTTLQIMSDCKPLLSPVHASADADVAIHEYIHICDQSCDLEDQQSHAAYAKWHCLRAVVCISVCGPWQQQDGNCFGH